MILLKRKLICLLAAAVTVVSLPAVVLADDEIVFVEDENTGEVTVDTSSDDNEAEDEDDKEDKSEDKDNEDKKTSGSKRNLKRKPAKMMRKKLSIHLRTWTKARGITITCLIHMKRRYGGNR